LARDPGKRIQRCVREIVARERRDDTNEPVPDDERISREGRPALPAAHSGPLTVGSLGTSLVMCGSRSAAIRPI